MSEYACACSGCDRCVVVLPFSPFARAQAATAQLCWAVGTYDRTIYYAEAEEREDRERHFTEMLTITGIEFTVVQCITQTIGLQRVTRDRLIAEWLEEELEIVDTTFLSDLDY